MEPSETLISLNRDSTTDCTTHIFSSKSYNLSYKEEREGVEEREREGGRGERGEGERKREREEKCTVALVI